MEKYRFFIYHIYIIYCVDPAQLLHIVVKQASKTQSQTPKKSFHSMLPMIYDVVGLLLYVPSQQLWSLRDGQFT